MHRTASLALLFATGCFGVGEVDEDNWTEKYANVYCKQTETCARGLYESEFSDREDCIDEVQDQLEEQEEVYDELNCDFDEAEAQECLESFNSADCESVYEGDFVDDCDKVFDCD